MIGSRLGPYEITAKLGEGGMGEVFRARDTRLNREVALKVLPPGMSADAERLERFRREAQAVAALNHPNIVTLHSFEESGDVCFLTMELVEGAALDTLIPAGGFDLETWLEIGVALADAVAAAHAKGIVHRDLKPANIMIGGTGERRQVKVLDFGLARMAESGTGAPANAPTLLTGAGVVMGTLPYMSPEQVRGVPLDERTDLFSLGVILYEMAAGRRPFSGGSSVELGSAILRDTPPPLAGRREVAPADVERILRRCLEKEPRDRIASARALYDELRLLRRDLAVSHGSSGRAPAAPADPGADRAEEGLRVAVLPFRSSGDAEMASFADGLGEEITTGLSRFRYLSVVANASAARLKGEAGDERKLGAKVGARYLLEGSLRKGGSALRVSAQLVDAETGARLWAETYDRDLQTTHLFAAQDDVAARIVATVADTYGVLVHSIRAAMRQKDDAELTPVEWQFQYFAYREQITPASHAALEGRLERALKRDQRQSELWACLAQIYVDQYAFGFGADASSLDRALAAARRAVEIDRANQFALVALAQVHFFRRDLAAFGPTAERAMALNPLNTDAVGILGLEIVHTGEFERGTAIVLRAMELNPNHAGWMHFAPLWNHFHRGEYEQALERANRVDVPGLFWPYLVVAAACGHLGRRADAEAAVRDLLALDPDFASHARSNVGSWHFASGLLEPILEGLCKAGLEIADIARPPGVAKPPDSGAVRADEGFWVAVLPFKCAGGSAGITALAEGLSEEIVTGLSRFSYLRVVSRSSTLRFAGETADVRSIGKELGARYVMEGSIRQAGTKVRLAVQLVDTTTGAHLWAETFDRGFDPEAAFELQDDLVPRIVSTVADQNGVLTRRMSETLRNKNEEALTPQEAVLRAFSYFERVTPDEHAVVRRILERAVREAPDYADAWAMLSLMYTVEFADDFNPLPDSLGRALAAAQRSVHLAATQALGHYALAFVYFLRKEMASFRAEAEKALALNPMDGSVMGILGVLVENAGESERGCRLAETAMQLNPNFPGLFRWAAFTSAYGRGQYAEALEVAVRINMPNYFYAHAARAAALGQLGRREAAEIELGELLALRPDFATEARREFSKWYDSGRVERMIEGLRKAGLDIAPEPAAGAPGSAPARSSLPASGASRADEGFRVAVLPFKCAGGNADLAALAEGFSEEIVTGLSRFPYLRLIAQGSTSPYANRDADVRSAGRDLGARYVMEGSIRQVGPRVRFAAQLVDAVSGAHLWAETYDRAFRAEQLFELQDDVVPRIVSTCGDRFGVLARAISEAVRARPRAELTPYESLMRGFGYHFRLSPEEHAEAREVLEQAVEQSPTNPDCWAMLSWVYSHEHAHGFNAQPGSLDRALSAARRAVDLAPSNSLAQQALAVVLFFRKETAGCLSAAERALALNPLDASNESMFLIAFAGDWERGCALIRRAVDLNPHHPRWYELILGLNEFRLGQYRAAVTAFDKADMGESFWKSALLAAAHGELGERAAASKALRELLALKEDFAQDGRAFFENWFDPLLVEGLMNGLGKAGLDIAPKPAAGASAPGIARFAPPNSGASRADEGFWVAVLPFKHAGGSAELAALAEGFSEEIVTGLSRFSYLRVISRSSTERFGGETADVRSIGKELGARYVMEGSLRQAASKLRLAVQLVDAASGAQLWAESYERPFSPETAFELQDDLVPRIVSTVADIHGVLPRSMGEAVRNRSPEELSPYEAVLRSFVYFGRVTGEELSVARSALELAVERAPDFADAWAMLAVLCAQDYGQGFGLLTDPLASGAAAARRAVEVGPSNHLAHFSLAQVLYFQRERQAFRIAAERAVALNPMDGNSIAFMGELLVYSGDFERGLALAGRAKELNPNHPGWYWYANYYHAYLHGNDAAALEFAHKVNLPKHWGQHVALAAALGQLGESAAAAKAVRDLLAIRPDCAAAARHDFEKWWESEYVERLIDGLRKAGLDVPAPAGSEPVGKPATTVAIAVLPFADMSPTHDQEYLCEGMAEEIMSALVRIDGLRVAARTSAFRAQRDGGDPRAIGERLGVGLILEGSVRTAGARLRATAQLIDVASGFQLWSERYDREAADVFAVQDEIANGVVGAVRSRLAPGTRTVPDRPQPMNLEAYRSYLKGRSLRGKEHYSEALGAFEEAVRLDPSHAPSWTGLAEITVLAATFGMLPPREACASAREALAAAARLQGESAEGLHVEGFVAWIERRWKAMESAWRRAIELEPTHVLSLASFGIVLCTRQRLDEALPFFERAREADPLASFPYTLTGMGLLNCGRPQEAERFLEDALSFEKEDATALDSSGIARVALGRVEEGIATLEKVVAVTHRAPYFLGTLGWALATAGRTSEARTLLQELRSRPPASPTVVSEACLLGALGELDAAFDVIVRAEEECQAYLYFTGLPGFDPLRADPRFAALEKRLGLTEQAGWTS